MLAPAIGSQRLPLRPRLAARLAAQRLTGPPARTPLDVVERLLAVQGQDPAVTVAAYVPALSSSLPRPAWLLASTDSAYWTDQTNVDANASLFAAP